jgi:regulator of nucleoside diphosphate kinase
MSARAPCHFVFLSHLKFQIYKGAFMDPQGILISDQDFERLSLLVQHSESRYAIQLEEELARATIVRQEEILDDIVTMNSKIRFIDEVSGKESEVTLVYPEYSDVSNRRISVLAPVGMALIGLKVGQSIEWPMPNGPRKLKVVSIVYQPEAEGHWNR